MNDLLKSNFVKTYSPIVEGFLSEIEGLNLEGIPELDGKTKFKSRIAKKLSK